MRYFVRSAALFLTVFGVLLSGNASSIPLGTYNLNTAAAAGSPLTGTVTLDSNGYVTSANLRYANPGVNSPTFTNIASTGLASYNPGIDLAYISGANGQVALYYFNTLDASGNLALCIFGTSCASYQASYVQIYTPGGFNGTGSAYLSNGDLSMNMAPVTSLAVTPEPSPLVLLCSGVLVVSSIGAVRRMLSRSSAAQ